MAKSKTSSILLGIGLLILFLRNQASGLSQQFAKNFQVADIAIKNLKPGIPNFTFDTVVTISNFNPLPVRVTGANLRLNLDGKEIGSIITNKGGEIAPETQSKLTVPTSISLVALGTSLSDVIDGNDLASIVLALASKQLTITGQVFGANGFSVNIKEAVTL